MDQQLVKKCLLNIIHEVRWSKHEVDLDLYLKDWCRFLEYSRFQLDKQAK